MADYNEQEFTEEIQGIVKLIEEAKMPEWWVSMAKQISDSLQVHTNGHMFDKITGLYPNEHPDSQKHCINSYETITTPSIWKAINNIIRVFNNSSYNIQISEKTRTVIEEYQDSEGSLFSQFLEDWIRYAIAEDPNGICVTYPLTYTDDLYRYVCYKDLIKVSDNILIFISEVESETKKEIIEFNYCNEVFADYENLNGAPNVRTKAIKTYNPKLETKYVNKVFHVFTKTHFIKVYKTDPGQTQYEYEYIKHPKELETLPYFENGGIEVEKNVYKSFVQDFVPFGNLALMAHRNQRANDLNFSYPRMSEVQQPCDTCSGKGETRCIKEGDTNVTWETCKDCKGSKYVSIQSPYKIYRKVHDSFDADNKVFSTPSVEFYTPPIGVLDYTQKNWKEYLSMAEMAVFVQQKVETGNVEAAKSKEIDREELYAWLANISKVLYNNLQMFLQYLEGYINASPITVSVERPYSFAILTESEAFEALSKMLSTNVPVPIKANQIDSFINKFISDSSPVKRALQVLKKFDLLLYYSDSAVSDMKGNAFIDSKMAQKHALAYPVLIQMYELDKTLFELEDEQIIKKLDAEISKFDMTKSLKESVLNAE